MSKKGKLILIIVGIFFLSVLSVLFILYKEGIINFHADVVNTISNTATVQYCKQGDTTATCDPTNNKYTYQDQSNTVVVNVTSSDVTPPTSSITSPTAGASVSNTITISATASDDIGVTKVEFYWDNTNLIGTSTSSNSPYTFSWNTTTVTNGSHSLTAKAYDAGNNIGTSAAVNITVNNVSSPLDLTLTIKDRTGSSCLAVNGTITINAVGNGTPIISNTPISLATNCHITFTPVTAIPSGQYNIQISISSFLKKTINNITLPSASALDMGSFIPGDLDGNDCINMFDWGKLAGKWGATPTSGNWDATYDLKGDGYIGMPDWGVMFDGWGQGSLAGCSS